MPNQYQWTFLLSFTTVFGLLSASSLYAFNKLRASGYDPANLILYGLPKREQPPERMASIAGVQIPQFVFDYPHSTAWATGIIGLAVWYVNWGMKRRQPALDPTTWKEFPLIEKIQKSPNTAIYRFGLDHLEDVLGLPIGQHISIAAEIDGKEVVRSYTPTSSEDTQGHFDVLIKTYEQGNISKHIAALKIGQTIRVKGPKGQFLYGPDLAREIGMIAGGTGITPMFQIIKATVKNPFNPTKLTLIYANVNVEDILMKDELDGIAAKHPDQLTIFYVLNNPPANWKGGVGFVTAQHIKEHLPAPASDVKILLCGPPPMNGAMKKNLESLGYTAPRTVSKLADQVFVF
jgi:cytochrome-b5 reductase